MRHDEFLKAVRERAGLEIEGAERATEATLTALAERLEKGEATDFASQLPQDLKEIVRGAAEGSGEPISLDEFVGKVAEKEGVGEGEAREQAGVVFEVLREQLTEGQVDDVLSQLPDDYRELFGD